MDQERPRSDLSINSRNNLRKVLHLEFLYKENKVHACNVWRDVLELRLAMSKQAWALPAARGGQWEAGTPTAREKQTQLSAAEAQLCVSECQPSQAQAPPRGTAHAQS